MVLPVVHVRAPRAHGGVPEGPAATPHPGARASHGCPVCHDNQLASTLPVVKDQWTSNKQYSREQSVVENKSYRKILFAYSSKTRKDKDDYQIF